MSQLLTDLAPAQRTAIRLAARNALMGLATRVSGALFIGRPLQARDLIDWDYPSPCPARLHTGPVRPGVWTQVACRRLSIFEALAVWGYVVYSRDSQIDVVQLGWSPIATLSELPTSEIALVERRDPQRVRRRSGWIDPPLVFAPQQNVRIAVLSDQGIPQDEAFGLLGLVVEPEGKTVVRDGVSLALGGAA